MADYKENLDHDTVTLYLDNDEEVECDVIAIFPARDGDYIALAPQNTKPAYIMAKKTGALWAENDVAKTDESSPKLDNIEDDEEFEEVSEAFYEYMDENDYEDLDEGVTDGE